MNKAALLEQMDREVSQYKISSWKWYCHTDPGGPAAASKPRRGFNRSLPHASGPRERAARDVFTTGDLRPLLDQFARTPEAPAAAVHVVQGLAQLGPALHAAINRTNGLSRDAAALAQSRGGERALAVSTRFAPIVGSQLGNFGAFLDFPSGSSTTTQASTTRRTRLRPSSAPLPSCPE